MSLFRTNQLPLAEKLRPKSIEEVIGQQHLLGQGKPLSAAFVSKSPHSMIFWGPPGVGKTTLARLMTTVFDCEWVALSAVFAGVKDIRQAVQKAQDHQQFGRHTILFIDEIHRFNKAQQDALLPFTESGLLTFIGATTENPSFEVNRALLSRAQVYVLESLSDCDLRQLIDKAKSHVLINVDISEKAITTLIHFADGDARKLLNVLEQLDAAANATNLHSIDENILSELMASHLKQFDKGGDAFYDQISALHKSVRGSNPDAALYWFTRMIDGGTDPHYLARRILRMAWEDIGLADPRAIDIALNAYQTFERLGSPEGDLALGQAVIYLSVAAKSNAGYLACKQAKAFVEDDKSRSVPHHLRNAPTKLMKDLNYGAQYRYAHDEPYAYAAGVHYFPDDMPAMSWYFPANRGLEIKISEKMAFLKKLDKDFVAS